MRRKYVNIKIPSASILMWHRYLQPCPAAHGMQQSLTSLLGGAAEHRPSNALRVGVRERGLRVLAFLLQALANRFGTSCGLPFQSLHGILSRPESIRTRFASTVDPKELSEHDS